MNRSLALLATTLIVSCGTQELVPDRKSHGGKVVIIGTNAATAKYLPAGLRNQGYEPVFLLQKDKKYEGESQKALAACECHLVDLNDADSVMDLLRRNPNLQGGRVSITTPLDEKFFLAEKAVQTFGMNGPDPAAAKLSGKEEVYRLIPEFCPKAVTFKRAEWGSVDLTGIGNGSGWILKPSRSAGAIGMASIPPEANLEEAVRLEMSRTGLVDADSQTWILQEKLSGRLISLEGFVEGGETRFLGFSLRARIQFSEVANIFPAEERLPPPIREHCRRAVGALVKRSGFRNGYFHCEFLMTDKAAYLIDANMGRLIGGAAVEQVALAHGIQPEDVAGHVALLALFPETVRSPYRKGSSELQQTLAINYCLPRPSVLREIQLPVGSPCRHTQLLGNGAKVPAVGTSAMARVGALTGLTADVIRDIEHIVIHTDDGPMKPAYAIEE